MCAIATLVVHGVTLMLTVLMATEMTSMVVLSIHYLRLQEGDLRTRFNPVWNYEPKRSEMGRGPTRGP